MATAVKPAGPKPTTFSTNPPTLPNPRGTNLNVAVAVVLAIMTIVVFMRLWGRYRYKTPARKVKARYGESRFWILLSDLTIVFSYLLALALSIVAFMGVRWGEGLHLKQLSPTQIHTALEMFFIYQVLYKFVSGMAKIATLFLLLAISTPQMKAFNLFCKIFAGYIAAYCFACSMATIFQCGTSIESNWNHNLDLSQCFTLPPFWYSHAAINISATIVMIFMPWWLFASISYKRRHVIASIMSALAVGETVLGIVRLYGLYTSAHSAADMTYGTVTGIMVSQLEVDFACIAACVPTVLKMTEELFVYFCINILGIKSMASWSEGSRGNTTDKADTSRTGRIQLSQLRTVDGDQRPRGPYTNFDEEGSTGSQEHIVKKNSGGGAGGIEVRTDYYVTVKETNPARRQEQTEDNAYETHVFTK